MGVFDSAILLGIGGSLLYSLKSIPEKIFEFARERLIFKVKIYDKDQLYHELEAYLKTHHKKGFKNLQAGFDSKRGNPSDQKKSKSLFFRHETNLFSIKYRGRRIFINQYKEKLENAQTSNDIFYHQIDLYGWRAGDQIKELLEEITHKYNESIQDNKLCLYTCDSYGLNLFDRRFVKPLSKIVLKSETKTIILEDLKKFIRNKKWYNDNNILYKRAYLFHGPPGTGKTTLSMAIASELNRDLVILNIGSFSNDSAFISATSNIDSSNKVIHIDEIDTFFEQRTGGETTRLSFSILLNWIDGPLSKEDTIITITTNHIEKLDAALLRAGRVDVKILIDNAGEKEVKEFLNGFYLEPIGKSISLPGISIPISSVQEICLSNKDSIEGAITQLLNYKNS